MTFTVSNLLTGSALKSEFLRMLRESAINDDVILARGYKVVAVASRAKQMGFSEKQCRVPALAIPLWNIVGDTPFSLLRPKQARLNGEGKPVKYEMPQGAKVAIDVHPMVRDRVKDVKQPIFITEGIKKGDSLISKGLCALSLISVTTVRGRDDDGGLSNLPDWGEIPWNGRTVYVVFDADMLENSEVDPIFRTTP